MKQRWAQEAREAWRSELRRIRSQGGRGAMTAIVLGTGAAAVIAIALRIEQLFDGPLSRAVPVVTALVLVAALVGLPAWLELRDRARMRVSVREARGRAGSKVCPRCGAPHLARGPDEIGERACGGCGASLLEAEGLSVVRIDDERCRKARWRSAARQRLARVRPRGGLGPFGAMAASVAALGLLFGASAAVGGAVGVPPQTMETSIGRREEVPNHGRARARGADDALYPPGPASRPLAPLWVGTQVLARMGEGPYHQLAVILRVEDLEAFVVYADGDADWLPRSAILAPELAAGDDVEVYDGARWRRGRLDDRVGPALRVDGLWENVSRVRVRADAPHARDQGRNSEVPQGAWVEVEVSEDTWRPGVAIEAGEARLLVALSEGGSRVFDRAHVRAQAIGPGTRVWIDGAAIDVIVAARVGHALAVVAPDGSRSWTALSRVRRR